MPSRDPPAASPLRKKTISDFLEKEPSTKNSKHDRYTSVEGSDSTIGAYIEKSLEASEEVDSELMEEARQCMLRFKTRQQMKLQRQRQMSFGEDEAKIEECAPPEGRPSRLPVPSKLDDRTESTVSTVDDDDEIEEDEFRCQDGVVSVIKSDDLDEDPISLVDFKEVVASKRSANPTKLPEKREATSAEGESESKVITKHVQDTSVQDSVTDKKAQSVTASLPGFWHTFLDFLTTTATSVCSPSDFKRRDSDIDNNLQYEMPLISIQDIDEDIEAWGVANEEEKSLKPRKIAKAINFSSKRLDENSPVIALYDENKLPQEVHKVEIPEEYFDVAEETEDAYEDFSFLKPRPVPEAVVFQPTKVDDVSVLEDNSVATFDSNSVKAWSLSPRRKRRLRASARRGKAVPAVLRPRKIKEERKKPPEDP